jgi:hypothetical protein
VLHLEEFRSPEGLPGISEAQPFSYELLSKKWLAIHRGFIAALSFDEGHARPWWLCEHGSDIQVESHSY